MPLRIYICQPKIQIQNYNEDHLEYRLTVIFSCDLESALHLEVTGVFACDF